MSDERDRIKPKTSVIDQPVSREVRAFDTLTLPEKIQFIWNYHKVALSVIAIAVYIVCYLIFRVLTDTVPYLYVGMVNIVTSEQLTYNLTDGFLESEENLPKKSSIHALTQLYLTEALDNTDASYVYASQMKILAAIDGEELDLVLLDKDAFDAFSQNGYLCNMEEYLKTWLPESYDQLSPFLEMNIEILEDNATDVMLNKELSYEAEVLEYPMGLNLSSCEMIRNAGFPEDLFLAIIKNSPRMETVSHYIGYLYS